MDDHRLFTSIRVAAPEPPNFVGSREPPDANGIVLLTYDDQGRVVQCVTRVAGISESRAYQDVGPIGTGEEGDAFV